MFIMEGLLIFTVFLVLVFHKSFYQTHLSLWTRLALIVFCIFHFCYFEIGYLASASYPLHTMLQLFFITFSGMSLQMFFSYYGMSAQGWPFSIVTFIRIMLALCTICPMLRVVAIYLKHPSMIDSAAVVLSIYALEVANLCMYLLWPCRLLFYGGLCYYVMEAYF